ncbi:AbgT family transporter [Sedimentibacter sp.]|uniref:YfcC family protein n=1 Tax=Sedimentibacter sp. TaxID=1960295 RepID=UPI0028A5E736|nr:AbgT family transporter [Sedimentibacter sp.]
MVNSQKGKKERKFPHVYVVLLTLVVICAVLTYIVPAGAFDRVETADGRMVVDPASFHTVERTPVSIFGLLSAVPKGMVEVADIIFFIFIVGGSFAVVQDTGAIEAGIGKITKSMSGKEKLLIPVIMAVFSLSGGIFGMAEETLPFIPIMVTLALAMGFDSMTGIGMVLAGAGAGFAGAFMNPFTVGVAQGIAGLPLFSGMWFRIAMYIAMTIASILFVYRYASKVKENPKISSMHDFDKRRDDTLDLDEIRELNKNDKLVLLTVAATIILLVIGVVVFEWYIIEISALFLGMSIVVAVFGKLGFNGFAERLVEGMAGMAGGALIVGFARAILVVLTEGSIMDTILFGASNLVSALPSSFTVIGMYLFQCLLNVLIPSGSGQAAVSIPIMAPLADLTGITRQTAVLAYQLGDGISNILTPTSGYFMAGLALAKVPWEKWAKWFIKLALIQYLIGAVFILIAHVIQLGPF